MEILTNRQWCNGCRQFRELVDDFVCETCESLFKEYKPQTFSTLDIDPEVVIHPGLKRIHVINLDLPPLHLYRYIMGRFDDADMIIYSIPMKRINDHIFQMCENWQLNERYYMQWATQILAYQYISGVNDTYTTIQYTQPYFPGDD